MLARHVGPRSHIAGTAGGPHFVRTTSTGSREAPVYWTLPENQDDGKHGKGGSIAGTVSIEEDGTFTSNLGRQPGPGTFRIVDGKAVYEGANMRGTAALHGSGVDQVSRGEGTWVGSPGQSEFELRRR